MKYFLLRIQGRIQKFLQPLLKKLRRQSLLRRERYIFTDKKHPERGIFSVCLGLIALCGIVLSVKFTFDLGGVALFRHALAVLLSFVFALTGLVFGILSRREKDVFHLFPNTGITFNVIAILSCLGVLYLGLMA